MLLDAKVVAEGISEPDTVFVKACDAVSLPLPPASDDEAREEAEAPLVEVPPPPTLTVMTALAVVREEMERAGDKEGVPEEEAVPSMGEDDAAGEDEVPPEAETAGVAVVVMEPHALTDAEDEDSSTPEGEATSEAERALLAVVAAEAEALSVDKAELVEAKEVLGLPDAPSEPVAPLLPLGLPVGSGVGVALVVDDGHDEDDGECEGLPEVDGERRGVVEGGGDRDADSVSPVVADFSALPEAPVAVGAPAVALPTEERVALGSVVEDDCRDGVGATESVRGGEALGGEEPVNGSDGDAVPDNDPFSLGEDSGVPEAMGEPLGRELVLPLLLGDSVFGDPVTPLLPLPLTDCVAEPLNVVKALTLLDTEAVGAALEGLPKDGDAPPVDEKNEDAEESAVPMPLDVAEPGPADAVAIKGGEGVAAEDAVPPVEEDGCEEADGERLSAKVADAAPVTLLLPLRKGESEMVAEGLADPVPQTVAELEELDDEEPLALRVSPPLWLHRALLEALTEAQAVGIRGVPEPCAGDEETMTLAVSDRLPAVVGEAAALRLCNAV